MGKEPSVYFDYAATTPLDERVMQAMMPFFGEVFGNPSSVHWFGQQAEAALENARLSVAECLNADPAEIIFTSGGSESDNLALRGASFNRRAHSQANRILISPVEHPAVQNTAYLLERQHGFEVDVLPVDRYGRVDPEDVAASISANTALVSVIYANNEIGTINPIAEIGQICRQRGVLFHTDAVQASAHLPMDVERDSIDLLSIGAHKFYGPKGAGVLYVHRGVALEPAQTGGAQESGLRAGTHNVPYIVGLAEAFTQAQKQVEGNLQHLQPLRDFLIGRVLEDIPQARLTGHPSQRLPNHASFVFEGVDGNALLVLLDQKGFACSSGSACKVGDPKPSEVLEAIGLSRSWALGSLRVTLGRGSTKDQIEAFLEVLPQQVEIARKL